MREVEMVGYHQERRFTNSCKLYCQYSNLFRMPFFKPSFRTPRQ